MKQRGADNRKTIQASVAKPKQLNATEMDITVESSVDYSTNTSSARRNRKGGGVANQLRLTKTWKAVFTGRVVFIICLAAVAAGLGTASWLLFRNSEEELGEQQFQAIAERAINGSQAIVVRKRLGTISMVSVLSSLFPKAEEGVSASGFEGWPFVYMDGYEEVAQNIIATSSGREMGFCPLVYPDQLSDFETHAYDWFLNLRQSQPPFPDSVANSSFGQGIWQPGPDGRAHVTDGSTSWGSPYEIVTPILQHNLGAHPALMLNLHFNPTRGVMIDNIITCVNQSITNGDSIDHCLGGAVTDMINLTSQTEDPGPSALLFEPIFPAFDNRTLVGLLASSIAWRESLEDVFNEDVSGVDCVLTTPGNTFTYGVRDGVPYDRGFGDLHDSSYNHLRHNITLTPDDLFSEFSTTYQLEMYPNSEFFETYETNNPRNATIGAVCIIVFVSALFFVYDFCVHKEFDARQELLEAKRMFVRFVSHEVRTPLNTVCMGLELMQEEMVNAMDAARRSGTGNANKDSQDKKETKHTSTPKLQGEQLVGKTVKGEDAFEWLSLSQSVLNNAQASVDVLNDLLNYDKVQMGELSLELSVVSLWELLDSTVNEFRLAAQERKINLSLDFGDVAKAYGDSPELEPASKKTGVDQLSKSTQARRVVGDVVRLSQVIRNLVSNGLKFTPEDGGLSVLARVEIVDAKAAPVEKTFKLSNGRKMILQREGVVFVDVTDTGAGMTPEQVETVFNDGTQFNANTLQGGGGSGLGLFIAKGICKQHGGSLGCKSDGLGNGTTFTLKLPLYKVPGPQPNHAEGAAEIPNPTEDTGESDEEENRSARILAVDDSLSNLKLLTRMLTNRGHHCIGASNGEEAVNLVEQNISAFDSILLDFEMPVMNGPTACAHIRKLGCSAFIVGITGNVLPEDVARFKEAGANAVLPKPFKLASLEQLWSEYGVTGRHPDSYDAREPLADEPSSSRRVVFTSS
mmetsp:Transcript_6804/g.17529  ORF Transcript_6804/g.17529 Transcript_6804/m.17529 type:complete len:971 (+) Transcript_6804:35-2947(+)